MKHIDKNVYSDWDSPHTFCQYQTDSKQNGLICTEKVFDFIDKDIEPLDKECGCPFTEKTAKKCKLFIYHKHDKNPNAKRYAGHKI